MDKKKYHTVIPYGLFLGKYFKKTIVPGANPNKELIKIVEEHKPDCIITYNCNGSSYELKLDNINLYKWCENFLKTTKIPKFHFTTDYCRSGFKPEQSKWFSDLNYTAAFFRHKVSLNHPIDIPAYWIPFSVDRELYEKNSIHGLKVKKKKVGFIGAAHNSAQELYKNRIEAINYLKNKDYLSITKIINNDKFERKMLFQDSYVDFLTKNLFNLTCGGTCNFFTAKYFQIPAAYSMLVCSDTVGLDMFPEDTYIKYDIKHLDEMFEKIKLHEMNLKLTKVKISNLNQYVLNNHSHHQRILDLTKVIKLHL
jgi:hypothetical protein